MTGAGAASPAARRTSTQADRDRAVEMRERGCSVSRIAADLGFSYGAVSWWLLQAGAETPGGPPPPPRRSLRPVLRGGHLVDPYTPAEDAALLQMERAGLGYGEIARRLTALYPGRPRKRNSVLGRLLTLARHEAAAELRQQHPIAPPRTPAQPEAA